MISRQRHKGESRQCRPGHQGNGKRVWRTEKLGRSPEVQRSSERKAFASLHIGQVFVRWPEWSTALRARCAGLHFCSCPICMLKGQENRLCCARGPSAPQRRLHRQQKASCSPSLGGKPSRNRASMTASWGFQWTHPITFALPCSVRPAAQRQQIHTILPFLLRYLEQCCAIIKAPGVAGLLQWVLCRTAIGYIHRPMHPSLALCQMTRG